MVISPEDADDSTVTMGIRLPTQKGTSFLGSSILFAGIGSTDFNTDNSMHYNVGFNPRYGHFVANNFAIGIDLNAGIEGDTKVSVYTVNTGVGVFARCYTGKASNSKGEVNRLRFFVEGGAGYGYVFNRDEGQSADFDMLKAHLVPGINYFVNRNVAFELGISYTYQHLLDNKIMPSQDYHNVMLSLGLQFFFGKQK